MNDPFSNLNVSSGKGISKIDPVSIPGFGPANQQGALDMKKHRIRYSKIDLDDPGSIAELEILETRAIRNEGIYIIGKEKFPFMDKVMIVVQYLEKDPTT